MLITERFLENDYRTFNSCDAAALRSYPLSRNIPETKTKPTKGSEANFLSKVPDQKFGKTAKQSYI